MKRPSGYSGSEGAGTKPSKTSDRPPASISNGNKAERRARNLAAIRLLREWMGDDSGYDEKVWPSLKEGIERNRLAYRKRFSD